MIKLLKFVLWLYDLPFIVLSNHFGKNSHIGLGYSLLFSSKAGVSIGDGVSVGPNAAIQTVSSINNKSPVLEIGNNSMIGKDFFCSSAEKIIIGKNCLFSWRVTILDHDHVCNLSSKPISDQGVTKGVPVYIGDNTFIGINTVVLKGVSLGKHCVVGANSVVTKSFPPFSVIAGNPAKLIKQLSN